VRNALRQRHGLWIRLGVRRDRRGRLGMRNADYEQKDERKGEKESGHGFAP